jgi:hypothetical protein
LKSSTIPCTTATFDAGNLTCSILIFIVLCDIPERSLLFFRPQFSLRTSLPHQTERRRMLSVGEEALRMVWCVLGQYSSPEECAWRSDIPWIVALANSRMARRSAPPIGATVSHCYSKKDVAIPRRAHRNFLRTAGSSKNSGQTVLAVRRNQGAVASPEHFKRTKDAMEISGDEVLSINVQVLPDDNLSVIGSSDLCQVLLVGNGAVRWTDAAMIDD